MGSFFLWGDSLRRCGGKPPPWCPAVRGYPSADKIRSKTRDTCARA